MRIVHIVGARPNFMKLAPVVRALRMKGQFHQFIVHTGQHYDKNMSESFFQELAIPQPDINLGVGSGSHAQQTSQIMSKIEPVLTSYQPNWVFVYGDVNSTLAATLVSAKMNIPVAHVEAGLRSFDRSMPEEINRLVTDRLANLLFTPSNDGDQNLIEEGIPVEQIHCVGNVIIDTLVRLLPKTEKSDIFEKLRLSASQPYALVTLHRPSNVDNIEILEKVLASLVSVSKNIKVVFPVHPRTRNQLTQLSVNFKSKGLILVDPIGYIDFLTLQKRATLVITDSGGVQEETTYLGVPCLTLRANTERPITVEIGTNTLIGHDMERLHLEVTNILNGSGKRGQIPPLWDGCASQRIADIMLDLEK